MMNKIDAPGCQTRQMEGSHDLLLGRSNGLERGPSFAPLGTAQKVEPKWGNDWNSWSQATLMARVKESLVKSVNVEIDNIVDWEDN